MNLLETIVLRIYDTTGMLPVNAVAGVQGNYQIHDFHTTPFLYVIMINPLQVSVAKFTSEKLAEDLKLVASLESSEEVVIDVHRGFVCVQVPRPADERGKTVYTSKNAPRGSGLRVPLGLDILNVPVDFNFGNEMCTNLSFLGVPGSGKSVAMRRSIVTLARNNAPEDVKFLMIEVAKNGIDLLLFDRLPHLIHPVITDPDEAAAALKLLVNSITRGILPYKLAVVIDEVAALIKARPDTIGDLMTLVSQGRSQNVINLYATQLSDRDTLGDGKAIFKQIHNVVVGKAGNKQLSYVLGNKGELKAEELVGQGDLKLAANDTTSRFTGIFTTAQEIEELPKANIINRLPLETNTPAEPIERSAQLQRLSPELISEGLESLHRQVIDVEYRNQMRGREYFVLPVKRVKELGRNPGLFKKYDQEYLVKLYLALRKRGVLCLK